MLLQELDDVSPIGVGSSLDLVHDPDKELPNDFFVRGLRKTGAAKRYPGHEHSAEPADRTDGKYGWTTSPNLRKGLLETVCQLRLRPGVVPESRSEVAVTDLLLPEKCALPCFLHEQGR